MSTEKKAPEPTTFTRKDNRFYVKDGKAYPRVTTILSVWPKGSGYERFLGNADSFGAAIRTRDEAGRRGTIVHKILERMVRDGYEPVFDDLAMFERDIDKQISIWECLMSFAAWWNTLKPTTLHTELTMHSEDLMTAGTCDFIGVTGEGESEKLILVDWKTSQALYFSHEIQCAVYAHMYEETTKKKVDEVYLLRLGTRHKSGFEYKEVEDRPVLVEHFRRCRAIWLQENSEQPKPKTYPLKISLK